MRQHSAPKSPYCACAIGRRAAYCQPAIDAQKATVSAKPIGSASKSPYCACAIGRMRGVLPTGNRRAKSDRIGKADRERQQKKATVLPTGNRERQQKRRKNDSEKEKNGKREKAKEKTPKSERKNAEVEMNEIRRLGDYNVFSSGSY